MSFDWYCDIFEKCSDDFQKLLELEKSYNAAKKNKDKTEKDKATVEIKEIYSNFSEINSSLIYNILDSSKRYNADGFRSYWVKNKIKLCEHDVKVFNLLENQFIPKFTNESLLIFPTYSFFLQFDFTLAAPYISRDDEAFYICDNPIRKDKVFKIPMAPGSSWKGNMRWTAGKQLELKINDNDQRLKRRIQLLKLFGHENEPEKRYFDSFMQVNEDSFKKELNECTNKNGLRSGRLYFYPTFFNQISLEVINPHSRKTKAGTYPIYIESVPADSQGTFSLLYVPFDLMGKLEANIKKEVADDLKLIGAAVKDMMLTYGFSAKKSSGFGIVKDKLDSGQLNVKGIGLPKKDFSDFSGLEEAISTAVNSLNNEATS